MRCLILKPSSLGDILHTFPAVYRLASKWQDCEFDWMTAPAFAGILDYSPVALRRKIIFRRKELGSWRFAGEFFKLAKELRKEGKYDIIIDFQGLFRSAVCGAVAGGREYAGFAEPREGTAGIFYKTKISVPQTLHAVERNWMLAGRILGEGDSPVVNPPLPVVEKNALEADRLLAEVNIAPGEPFFALLPGARWESKRFPAEFFAAAARKLAPVPCVVLGAPDEKEIAAQVTAASAGYNLAGKTSVGGLMEILRRASAALCNDSGAMHIAAALSTPVAGVYGPTDPERTGAFGAANAVFTSDEPCLKCLKRKCPLAAEPPCHSVNPEVVAEWMRTCL